MGVISEYFSDDDVISSLRPHFPRERQYTIDFRFWLNTAKRSKDGIIVTVESRRFLIDEVTGSVLRELVG